MRGERPFLFTNLRDDVGLARVIGWFEEKIGGPTGNGFVDGCDGEWVGWLRCAEGE
jgi:hypothetical protein